MGKTTYPDINGHHVAYASIEFAVDGVHLPGCRAINYKTTHEIPKIRGTSAKALGRVRGTEDNDGSIEILKRWEQILLDKISQGGSVGYAELAWNITLTYSEGASPQDMQTVQLIGVRFHSPEDSHTEGPDGLTTTYQMSIMEIIKNGKIQGLSDR